MEPNKTAWEPKYEIIKWDPKYETVTDNILVPKNILKNEKMKCTTRTEWYHSTKKGWDHNRETMKSDPKV